MKKKLKVFISYAHKNSAQRAALEQELTRRKHEVKHDVGRDHLSPELHKAISASINWSDVVVPILTPEWLASHECRDEVVRAHERRKRIVCFRHCDVRDDGPPKVPFFLRDSLSLYGRWSDVTLDRDVTAFVDDLERATLERWKNALYDPIRQIGDYVQEGTAVPRWKADLCRHLLEEQRQRLKAILKSDECMFDVSHENTYLAFADPIFRNAESITAICIAAISTFWTNPDFRPRAGNYLGDQRKSAKAIKRLFVFRDPQELVSYRNILHCHYLGYGKKGRGNGVFVCTLDDYEKLVAYWGYQPSGKHGMREDFGLLTFRDQGEHMHAILNSSVFGYREFGPDDNRIEADSHRVVKETFESLVALPEGEMDSRTRIVRWSEACCASETELAAQLECLFERRASPVRHYVVLKPSDPPALEPMLQRLVAQFENEKDALRIRQVELERRCNVLAVDGRYQSRLGVRSDFEYVLRLEFESEEALAHYYAHPLHSVEREKLYSALSPRAAEAFAKLEGTWGRDGHERSEAFAKIEAEMVAEGLIVRFDVRKDAPIEALVRKRGVPFGGLHN